ncbi:MAG: translation initiation factor [Verrucomicrobiota bacterium]|jgi:translation initiation factor IF-2|nr:translation initiation factor [Verrucomicrobiota bacterium]
MKVHELATDLDVSVEELLEILGDVEIQAEDGESILADSEVAIVCDELGFASIEEARAAKEIKNTPPVAAPVPEEEPPPGEEPVEKEDSEEEELPRILVFSKPQIAVKELAEKMRVKPNQLIAELMKMNIFASITQDIDIKIAKKIGEKHGFTVEQKKKEKPQPKKPAKTGARKPAAPVGKDRPEDLEIRPPIVTFMGHVDHGKTSLLDRIRHTKVVEDESGGITQHIGAYTVDMDARQITFLDTPGHAAFTAMRARGANLTDIAVVVVAADDGVMPQTIEAIRHAKAAGVCIIIAMNKMDLPGINPDRVKQQLNEHGVMVEDWGGNIGCIPVSAATGAGIDDLLERITLEAELLELKANKHKRAVGYVIEAQMEPGMGPTATLLVRDGTLKVGDNVLCGAQWGRIKALINDQGKKVRTAGPSHAVKCLGLTGVPGAGDEFTVCASSKEAKGFSEALLAEIKSNELNQTSRSKLSLDDLFSKVDDDEVKELPLIIKCDVQGSVEAIVSSLEGIKSEKVKLNILVSDVGNITPNDVMLASASNAIILGFHVAKENGVTAAAKREGIEIRLYSIIYELIEEVESAMSGLLEPELRETYLGRAEIRQVFDMGKRNKIAGCMVVEGKITSRASIRIKRGNEVLYKGTIGSLKRFQNDADEVRDGQECGIRPDNFTHFEEGDVIEAYTVEKVAQKL